MSFPLLRLPFLGQEKIVNFLTFLERAFLATISKKTRNTIRSIMAKESFSLKIKNHRFFEIQSNLTKYNICVDTKLFHNSDAFLCDPWRLLKGILVPREDYGLPSAELVKKYGNYEEMLKKTVKFLVWLFRNIASVSVHFNSKGYVKKVLDLCRSLELNRLHVSAIFRENESFEDILNESRGGLVTSIDFQGFERSQKKYEPTSEEPFIFENITFKEYFGITDKLFVKMFLQNAKRITIEQYQLRNVTFTQILKTWMRGNCIIEFLELQFGKDQKYFLKVMETIKKNAVKTVKYERFNKTFEKDKCFEIHQRDGGQSAIVFLDHRRLNFTIDYKSVQLF